MGETGVETDQGKIDITWVVDGQFLQQPVFFFVFFFLNHGKGPWQFYLLIKKIVKTFFVSAICRKQLAIIFLVACFVY